MGHSWDPRLFVRPHKVCHRHDSHAEKKGHGFIGLENLNNIVSRKSRGQQLPTIHGHTDVLSTTRQRRALQSNNTHASTRCPVVLCLYLHTFQLSVKAMDDIQTQSSARSGGFNAQQEVIAGHLFTPSPQRKKQPTCGFDPSILLLVRRLFPRQRSPKISQPAILDCVDS